MAAVFSSAGREEESLRETVRIADRRSDASDCCGSMSWRRASWGLAPAAVRRLATF